mmetsp:Transcript_7631/g.18565  ORF Transcript_7631/g.18565 Transcript_7631/m.18565 type:complete len:204 (-) Transcript_7631:57-668(-)
MRPAGPPTLALLPTAAASLQQCVRLQLRHSCGLSCSLMIEGRRRPCMKQGGCRCLPSTAREATAALHLLSTFTPLCSDTETDQRGRIHCLSASFAVVALAGLFFSVSPFPSPDMRAEIAASVASSSLASASSLNIFFLSAIRFFAAVTSASASLIASSAILLRASWSPLILSSSLPIDASNRAMSRKLPPRLTISPPCYCHCK